MTANQVYEEKDELNIEPSGGVNFICIDDKKVLAGIKGFRGYKSIEGEFILQIRKPHEGKVYVSSAKFSSLEMQQLIQELKILSDD